MSKFGNSITVTDREPDLSDETRAIMLEALRFDYEKQRQTEYLLTGAPPWSEELVLECATMSDRLDPDVFVHRMGWMVEL